MYDHKVNEILEECKDVQSSVDDFIDKFIDLHNIKKKYNNISLKQEIVAKNALFYDKKKNYILYVVNKEGVPVSEYDIKGLSIVRSEYPNITKERVSTLLDFIFKEDVIDFKKIKQFIEDTKKEIYNLALNGDKSVAKVVSYSKELDEYKKIPTHVKGMELWNELEYFYFMEASKGYSFYIEGIDTDNAPSNIIEKTHKITSKHNNIVVPWEEEKLPDYYVPDVNKIVEYAWDNRITDLFEPLGFGRKQEDTDFDTFEDF